MTIGASVVVPTYRRPELLETCLEALIAQDVDPTSYEIIVVDNAADEETRRRVDRLAAGSGRAIRYIPAPERRGPAAARNVGWRSARREVVAFTDDDCIPAQNWLRRALAVFVDGVAGAWGQILVPVPTAPTDYELNAARLTEGRFVTANCFYRRDTLEALGGFDERFEVAWREDTDLYFRLLERNECLVSAPDALVVHPIRPAPWGVSLRQQRKSVFNALLYAKHPELYRERIQASPPWTYYVIAISLLGGVVAWASGRRVLALGFGVLWSWLTGRFCADRLKDTVRSPRHILEMAVTSAAIPPVAVYWRIRGAIKFRVFFL